GVTSPRYVTSGYRSDKAFSSPENTPDPANTNSSVPPSSRYFDIDFITRGIRCRRPALPQNEKPEFFRSGKSTVSNETAGLANTFKGALVPDRHLISSAISSVIVIN